MTTVWAFVDNREVCASWGCSLHGSRSDASRAAGRAHLVVGGRSPTDPRGALLSVESTQKYASIIAKLYCNYSELLDDPGAPTYGAESEGSASRSPTCGSTERARRTHADGPRRQGDGGCVTRCRVTGCRCVSGLAIAVQHELEGARGANRVCVVQHVELTEPDFGSWAWPGRRAWPGRAWSGSAWSGSLGSRERARLRGERRERGARRRSGSPAKSQSTSPSSGCQSPPQVSRRALSLSGGARTTRKSLGVDGRSYRAGLRVPHEHEAEDPRSSGSQPRGPKAGFRRGGVT